MWCYVKDNIYFYGAKNRMDREQNSLVIFSDL